MLLGSLLLPHIVTIKYSLLYLQLWFCLGSILLVSNNQSIEQAYGVAARIAITVKHGSSAFSNILPLIVAMTTR